ncbi:putative dynein light chain 2, cytoplasmic [Toxocara canis]|uniref:Dynein light chain n=1 Tax=Toxocara canis TaxID=6265 RepID=A0A0B2VJB4_TOXCA|nr:putative dynein light chain 2, cytoplasmic [Toxocara canis]
MLALNEFDKAEVKETDMEPSMVEACIEITLTAQKHYSFDKDVAAYIKEECERRFGPTWHCVVGKSFGSRVSYEMQHFVLLRRRRVSIMIFKCGY